MPSQSDSQLAEEVEKYLESKTNTVMQRSVTFKLNGQSITLTQIDPCFLESLEKAAESMQPNIEGDFIFNLVLKRSE